MFVKITIFQVGYYPAFYNTHNMKEDTKMSEQNQAAVSTPQVDISTTETIRKAIEALADEPVIISVPIGGDASEFE